MSAPILSPAPLNKQARHVAPARDSASASPDWLAITRAEVDARLADFFASKQRETERISPPTVELVDEVERLTMRGGKRLRPAVAVAGYRCVRPGHGAERVAELGAAEAAAWRQE